jgi:rsbT co-antagonist protein RsbR
MASEIQQFGEFLLRTLDDDFDSLVAGIGAAGSNYDRVMGNDDLYQPVHTTLRTVAESMARNDMDLLARYGQEIGARRARDGFTQREMLAGIAALREHIWKRLHVFLRDREPWLPETCHQLENILDFYYENYSASVGDALEAARAELAAQTEQLEIQRQMIQELGTPIMPVQEGLLVLPLVGALDSQRAMQVMETLLEAITSHQADLVIIDITGVPMVDTSVANYILQAARAAHLVGAHIVLVGIGSTIARTIVQLGVDLSTITTCANLQEGLAFAYRWRTRRAT